MTYTKYIPELEDGQGNVYGLKDAEAREQISDLASALEYQTIYQTKEISNGVWADTHYSLLIPISAGDKVTVDGTTIGTSSPIGFLANVTFPITAGDSAIFSSESGFTDVITVEDFATSSFVAPSDAKYLYAYLGTNRQYTRRPSHIIINGYDYIAKAFEDVQDVSAYTLNKIGNTSYLDCSGYESGGKWTGVTGNNHSLIIPVNGGERLDVYAKAEGTSPVGGLRSFVYPPQDNDTILFSEEDGWSGGAIAVARCAKFTAIIPSDVKYLCFYCGNKTTNTRKPAAIYINGVNYLNRNDLEFAKNKNPINRQTLIIPNLKSVNHGGYHTEAPWNSLPAFKISRKKGFSWIETDVQFTSDNIPVLCHDNYINNYAKNTDGTAISETVTIEEHTYADLLSYDFGIGRGYDAKYNGLQITTFEQLMNLARDIGLNVRLELKKNTTPTNSQIDLMFEIAEKYGMLKNMEWVSNQLAALQYIVTKYPDSDVGYIVSTDTDAKVQTVIVNARTLCTGRNQVTLGIGTITESNAKLLVDNGFVLDLLVTTLQDILDASPYVTSFTSNELVVEDVLKDYYLADVPGSHKAEVVSDSTSLADTTAITVFTTKDDSRTGMNDPMVYAVQSGKTGNGFTRNDGSVVYPVAGLGSLPAANANRRKMMALIRSWIGRDNIIHTNNDAPDLTTLFGADCEADENGKFHADCSSFVSSLLMGISYNNSRYVRGKSQSNLTYFNDNIAFPPSNFEARSSGGLYTFELAEYFSKQKRLFNKPNDLWTMRKTLRFGDIGFGVDDSDPHYYGIAHCFFILGVVNDTIIIAHCNSNTADGIEGTVIHWRAYPRGGLQFFARPNYGHDYAKSYFLTKGDGSTVIDSSVLTPGAEIMLDNHSSDSSILAGMMQYNPIFSACEDFIPVIPGSTISFSGSTSNTRGSFAARIHEYNEFFEPVRRGQTILVSGTKYDLTVSSAARYIRPSFGWLSSAGNKLFFSDMDNFEITITPPTV